MTTTAATPTAKAPELGHTKLKDSYCVQGTNRLGAWNSDFLLFTDIGQPQYIDGTGTLNTISPNIVVYKSATEMWVVDAANDVYQWIKPSDPSPSNGWSKLEMLGKMKMVAFDPAGPLTAVSIDGKVVQWTTGEYTAAWSEINQSDWVVIMIAFDPKGAMWCVAEDSQVGGTRVGRWNKDYQRWASLGELQDRVVTMIGFDTSSTLWSVYDSAGNNVPAGKDSGKSASDASAPAAKSRYGDKIAYWDATGEAWVDPDPKKLTLPKVRWLTWKPA